MNRTGYRSIITAQLANAKEMETLAREQAGDSEERRMYQGIAQSCREVAARAEDRLHGRIPIARRAK